MSDIKNKMNVKMPAGMTMGPPTLRVKDLEKQLSFYENDLGLQVNQKYKTDDSLETVDLGFKGKFKDYKEPLLILKHDPCAKQTMHNFVGLDVFEIIVPDSSVIETLAKELEEHVQKANRNELLLSDPDGILILVQKSYC